MIFVVANHSISMISLIEIRDLILKISSKNEKVNPLSWSLVPSFMHNNLQIVKFYNLEMLEQIGHQNDRLGFC